MYIHDSHVHSKYSFDGAAEIDEIAEAAISRGVNEISITDHCDIDCILDGIYPPFEAGSIKEGVYRAKEKYKGKLQINYGVELGQAHTRKDEAGKLLSEQGYEFIIGSLHNLPGNPDFYFLKYDLMDDRQIDYLIRRSIEELISLIKFGGFSTLAHITYIERYLTKSGKYFDYKKYRDDFEELFRQLIKSGTALEINTSGLRRGGITMPCYELCGLYREAGGELITIGSDAHAACDVGAGIEEAAAALRDLGFKSQAVVRDGRLSQIEL